VDFSVVPGITAAVGCAAYAGIPLTHRDHAHSVSFVTATGSAEPDWRALALPRHTAVFYMGLSRLDAIVDNLIAHGAPSTRPAAVIDRGTSLDQRVITATLGTLRAACAGTEPASPALLVVGDVAALHETLAWFNPAVVDQAAQTA
jgi:siroheme synthase